MRIHDHLTPAGLLAKLDHFFTLSGPKIRGLAESWDATQGTPVFTVQGRYTTRGWTEWTQGFQYGCQILQFDATGDELFWALGRENTVRHMAPHVSHVGVHDHGFNNLSTYGNLRRLALEGRTNETDDALALYALAIKLSGAVQAARWTRLHDGTGFIHSFNGPHSLFSDTIRSCRILVAANALGHVLMGENDARHSLLQRAAEHLANTARYNVFYGEGRDTYDVWGRVAHEGIFNTTDGRYRCPSTQQGYTPFSTWTRGLAWVMLGAAEQLETLAQAGGDAALEATLLRMARATCDFYIDNTALDGVPYWDNGAPGLTQLGDWRARPAEPDNAQEPVDASAAAIAAQGLLRLGRHLGVDTAEGARYFKAGLSVMDTLLSAPYLSEDPEHQGLLLHSVYHRPNGWDHVPEGKSVPQGESSMWGDYHLMEAALLVKRMAGGSYFTYLDCVEAGESTP
jgi:unsaturated chondroitin disaccharide hydrolase